MVHITSFLRAMKLSWFRRLLVEENTLQWIRVFTYLFGRPELLFQFGTAYVAKLLTQTQNSFWKDALNSFSDLRKLFSFDGDDFLNLPLWYNTSILIGHKPVCFEGWIKKGYFFIRDLVNQDGNLMSYNDMA